MPLQHSHEHEELPAPLRTVPTQAPLVSDAVSAAALDVVSDAPRYDTDAVKKIIALAEQMQSHHRTTLTPDDIEALGHEVGVEPEFIRRALLQVEAGTTPVAKEDFSYRGRQAATEMSVEPFVFSVTRKQGRLLMVPLALYLLALPYTLGRVGSGLGSGNGSILAPVLLYCIVPSVLALYLAGKGKSYRFGALLGVMTGLLCVASVLVNAAITNHYTPSLEEIRTLSSVWAATGLVLGLSGAGAGKAIRRARLKTSRTKQTKQTKQTKRRLRVRVVMENVR